VASFSFRAGNAAKLLRAPLYALGRLATLLIPRGRQWVFGCGAGIGDGPLEVWRIARREGVDAVWLVVDDAEASAADAAGMRWLRRDSWRGFWATARARVAVVGFGLGDVNPYALSGAFVVQLWHGIPLKRIGLDSPETTRSPLPVAQGFFRALLGAAYARSMRRIDLMPASHALVRGRLESAFALPHGRVLVTGEPRVDPLSTGDARSRRASARAAIASAAGGVSDDAAFVLYAPTWRDGAVDPAVPSADEWRRIDAVLAQRGAVLFVRSHRLGEGDYVPPFATDRIRSLPADRLGDITPALPGFDVLVTDYSSLAFDAGLVPLPVVYFAPDAEQYATTRGFYGRYETIAGEDAARDWTAAAAQLDAVLAGGEARDERVARSESLSARVHAYRDGKNAQRVFDAVSARVRAEGARRAAEPCDEGRGIG